MLTTNRTRLSPFDTLFELDAALRGDTSRQTLAMDVDRSSDGIEIRLDVPGVRSDDIELVANATGLEVSVTRSGRSERSDIRSLVSERSSGPATRRIGLGTQWDTSRLTARLEHGVLTVHVPMAENAVPRRIAIAEPAAAASPLDPGAADGGAAEPDAIDVTPTS